MTTHLVTTGQKVNFTKNTQNPETKPNPDIKKKIFHLRTNFILASEKKNYSVSTLFQSVARILGFISVDYIFCCML